MRHRSPNLRAICPNLASPTTPSTYFLSSPARTSNANDAVKSRGLLWVSTFNQSFYPPSDTPCCTRFRSGNSSRPDAPVPPSRLFVHPSSTSQEGSEPSPMSGKHSCLDSGRRNRLTGPYHSGILNPPGLHLPTHRMQGNGPWSMLRLSGYVYCGTIHFRLQFHPPRSLPPMQTSQSCKLHSECSLALYTSPSPLYTRYDIVKPIPYMYTIYSIVPPLSRLQELVRQPSLCPFSRSYSSP